MILEINDDIIDYIDIEELKENVRYYTKQEIKKHVEQCLKDKDVFRDLIKQEIYKVFMDIDFSEKIKSTLQTRLLDVINNLEDFSIRYWAELDDKTKQIFEKDDNLNKQLIEKINIAVKNYEIDNYTISAFITEEMLKDEDIKLQLKDVLSQKLDVILEKM